MRPDFNEYFMEMAYVVAKRSTCLDRQVGCVLVDQDMRVMSCGYNGAPSKAEHCTDIGECAKELGCDCRAQHAEINALQYCKGRPIRCYCTLEPCEACTKMLRNAGVSMVFYGKPTNPAKSGHAMFTGVWRQMNIPQDDSGLLDQIRAYHELLGYPSQAYAATPDIKNAISALQQRQGREIALAMFQEMAELVNSFDWKPWKEYNGQPKVDTDNCLEELGDILFFMDSMLMNFGFTWLQLFERVKSKLDENKHRIENGYHS